MNERSLRLMELLGTTEENNKTSRLVSKCLHLHGDSNFNGIHASIDRVRS